MTAGLFSGQKSRGVAEEVPEASAPDALHGTLPRAPRACTLVGFEQIRRNGWSALMRWHRTRVARFVGYGAQQKVLRLEALCIGEPSQWFFIGDIHGDFYALFNAIEFIKAECPDFRIAFLGDLVDRGPHPIECFLYMLTLAESYPDRVLWIAGNHDVGIRIASDQNRFESSVAPSEFSDALNERVDWGASRYLVGAEFVAFVSGLPRAVAFPDGLLITHGGFPHTDLVRQLTESAGSEVERTNWLNSDECLKDFTWTRISRYAKKLPNRMATGCSYGFQDFQTFRDAVWEFLPVSRMVTGHDHPPAGFSDHPDWVDTPALTLTGFGFGDNYEEPEAYRRDYRDYLVLGHHCTDNTPEVLKLNVDRADLEEFFDSAIKPWFAVAGNE